ncbi:MAG: hypothetical protein ANABAC_0237 [Anaerolineae bacterium]|nr:MAG: hypothetical protein ANABAC_0237 [Anaerolineae bacterium]
MIGLDMEKINRAGFVFADLLFDKDRVFRIRSPVFLLYSQLYAEQLKNPGW